MSLKLDARHLRKVWIVQCEGRIVTGEEATALEEAVKRATNDFSRLVLHLGGVTRVDSTGMGLLVRLAMHVRRKGGDLRLAATPPFLAELLELTHMTSIFRMYETEDEAILSFLTDPALAPVVGARTGKTILVLDSSVDLGMFVRSILHMEGHEVLNTKMLGDAKLLVKAGKVDCIVMGSHHSRDAKSELSATLASYAPHMLMVDLPEGFQELDPVDARRVLLEKLG